VIAAQGRKVEALKAHKRWLMQRLFPREGETLPRLRFPEFRNGPEWEEIKAGELFVNRTEKGDDDLPIYSVTMTDGLVKRSSLDRRIDDLADAEGNKKAYEHDIAYNMMRMWQGACGVSHEECMVSPAYVVLSPQTGVHSDFYGYLFKLPQILRLLTSHSRGLTKDRLRLYYPDFSRIPLPRPDICEQRRIADCLHSLDAQIAAESEKVDVLKTYKKGLMQQLFPSPEGN
jgi:type I restriction enzyme S subunit